jgi:predicted metal-dependent HD superfamily phosphohydrolase
MQLQHVSSKWFSRLYDLYRESHRAYHNINHIYELMKLLDRFPLVVTNAHAVRMAIFFHDAIYDIGGPHGDNERRSADLWQTFSNEVRTLLLEGIGVIHRDSIFHEDTSRAIHRWIMATVGHDGLEEGDTDGKYFSSIDLCVLGKKRRGYELYAAYIRREYSSIPEHLYREKRAEVLEGFLRRDRIYDTEALHTAFELQARDNLQWEVSVLRDTSKPLVEDPYW